MPSSQDLASQDPLPEPTVQLHHGDCVRVMRTMDECSFDAVVTDPPYLYEFMDQPWDSPTPRGSHTLAGRRAQTPNDRRETPRTLSGQRRRLALLRAWHRRWAAQAFRLLKPGGYLVDFGGGRTHHHLALALELAGFLLRDELHWQYAQGLPKSMDISQAFRRKDVPDSRAAAQWQGWGTSLKPAHEPILLCQKPLEGTYCANLSRWGCGALNVDAGRIPFESATDRDTAYRKGDHDRFGSGPRGNQVYGADLSMRRSYRAPARFPSNVVRTDPLGDGYDRYFVVPKASRAERNRGLESLPEQPGQQHYGSLAGGDFPFVGPDGRARTRRGTRPQRNLHPTVKPIALMEHLLKLVVPPSGKVLDPFAGSGSTLIAAKNLGLSADGIDHEACYLDIALARLRAVRADTPTAVGETDSRRTTHR